MQKQESEGKNMEHEFDKTPISKFSIETRSTRHACTVF